MRLLLLIAWSEAVDAEYYLHSRCIRGRKFGAIAVTKSKTNTPHKHTSSRPTCSLSASLLAPIETLPPHPLRRALPPQPQPQPQLSSTGRPRRHTGDPRRARARGFLPASPGFLLGLQAIGFEDGGGSLLRRRDEAGYYGARQGKLIMERLPDQQLYELIFLFLQLDRLQADSTTRPRRCLQSRSRSCRSRRTGRCFFVGLVDNITGDPAASSSSSSSLSPHPNRDAHMQMLNQRRQQQQQVQQQHMRHLNKQAHGDLSSNAAIVRLKSVLGSSSSSWSYSSSSIPGPGLSFGLSGFDLGMTCFIWVLEAGFRAGGSGSGTEGLNDSLPLLGPTSPSRSRPVSPTALVADLSSRLASALG
ncbi:hypothetical protein GALMADRAFT_137520 [Galerina marginata CBS 339.88]|uniref:Uncharacterized protein n=1 Tax=Galerina marginata (strain CBS 339.88) TaxID=685588 RepID=A0A067TF10_GALM3|nr:hypothetical protein GALMADRAFT_137520 [Galerina marginata CBS 339.88]